VSSATVATTLPATTPVPATTNATTAEPSTTTTGAATTPSTLFASPPIEESFAAAIPPLENFEVAPATDVVWPVYDLPGGAMVYPVDISKDGEPIGQLVVAGRLESNQLFDTYARQLFNEPVPVVVEGLVQLDDGSIASSTSNSLARWTAINGAAVITAKLPDDDAGQWVWVHDGRIWAVRGPLAAEQFVAELLDRQRAGSDPFNYQGLVGELADRFPAIPGVTYYDLPRAESLAVMPNTWSWPCAEAFYLSFVPAVDYPDPQVADERSLFIDISVIGQACQDNGFLKDLRAELAANPNMRRDNIAGKKIYRSDVEVLRIAGDVLVHLSSPSSATMTEMAPLIATFVSAQPD
jgi:hypothetical protein